MSQLVQNPLPRKGTETNEAAHLNRLGHGSKSITPQGDGNEKTEPHKVPRDEPFKIHYPARGRKLFLLP